MHFTIQGLGHCMGESFGPLKNGIRACLVVALWCKLSVSGLGEDKHVSMYLWGCIGQGRMDWKQ